MVHDFDAPPVTSDLCLPRFGYFVVVSLVVSVSFVMCANYQLIVPIINMNDDLQISNHQVVSRLQKDNANFLTVSVDALHTDALSYIHIHTYTLLQ